MKTDNTRVLLIALAANGGIAVAKFVAAALTGSSAMLTEGVHSLVDSTNQLLLLYGQKRAAKAPDAMHPAGYGRELFSGASSSRCSCLRWGQASRFMKVSSICATPNPQCRR